MAHEEAAKPTPPGARPPPAPAPRARRANQKIRAHHHDAPERMNRIVESNRIKLRVNRQHGKIFFTCRISCYSAGRDFCSHQHLLHPISPAAVQEAKIHA